MADSRRLQELEAQLQTLHEILDHAYECVVVVDREGTITWMNRTYEELLGLRPGEAIGRPVTEVIENTRMHIVARTGIAEIGWTQKIRGQDRIVQRIPIIRDGQVVGAVGRFMFKDMDELRALNQRVGLLESKVAFYEQELRSIRGSRYTFEQIIGCSEVLSQAKQLALRAAQSQAAILLLGESGTGKELFAHAIHQSSARAAGPFVRVNCAAIPADLLEAELFGYEEGAFTGARRGGKPGKMELAHGGTLFLDEIGEMPLAMQAKMLRALQEKEVERVGGLHPRRVDVRIVAATNADLEARVAEGRFREDLYYRLNVIAIRLPPLRERREDIAPLVEHCLERLAEEQGGPPRRIAPGLMALLHRYSWPGNIRELFNLLERLVYTVDALEIDVGDLPPGLAARLGGGPASRTAPAHAGPAGALDQRLAEAERHVLREALERAGGNKAKAARLLGIHRSTLYDKLQKYGLAEAHG